MKGSRYIVKNICKDKYIDNINFQGIKRNYWTQTSAEKKYSFLKRLKEWIQHKNHAKDAAELQNIQRIIKKINFYPITINNMQGNVIIF